MKIRKNDMVMVVTGQDRGKSGKVLSVFPKRNQVQVEGVNKKIKHMKAREDFQGGRVEIFHPIDVSNVALLDASGAFGKVGYKDDAGKKVRFIRKTGKIVAPATTKKVKKAEKTEKATSTSKTKK